MEGITVAVQFVERSSTSDLVIIRIRIRITHRRSILSHACLIDKDSFDAHRHTLKTLTSTSHRDQTGAGRPDSSRRSQSRNSSESSHSLVSLTRSLQKVDGFHPGSERATREKREGWAKASELPYLAILKGPYDPLTVPFQQTHHSLVFTHNHQNGKEIIFFSTLDTGHPSLVLSNPSPWLNL